MSTGHEEPGSGPSDDGEVVFVVRVRLPVTTGGAPEIYGRAEHLKSHRSCYFKDCASLCEFMFSSLGYDAK